MIVVEADFADSDDVRVKREAGEFLESIMVGEVRFGGMNASTGEDTRDVGDAGKFECDVRTSN